MSRLEDHYDDVIEAHGYSRIDFGIGDLSAAELRQRFVAVDETEVVESALERPTIVTTGVGMTGPPHLGTVAQMLTAIRLQEAGLDVQFVIADLEPYHGGGDLAELRRLAERYRVFVDDLGFDHDRGVLRTQEEAQGVMHTGHLLARHYMPETGDYWPETEPTAWEKAVREMYDAASESGGSDGDATGPTSDAADAHSGVLHLADFLHPLLKGDYEQVVVILGIDEHALTVGTRRFAADIDGLLEDGVEERIAGLHGRMITGVGDHPKMGKSAPGSSISLDMSPGEIRGRILDAGGRNDDAILQSMRSASTYAPEKVADRETRRERGGEEWEAAKAEYAEYVIDLAGKWKRTREKTAVPTTGEGTTNTPGI